MDDRLSLMSDDKNEYEVFINGELDVRRGRKL